jgi:hypothetical protein
MHTMPNLQTLPRTVVRTYLQAARLPLTAAEQLLRTDEGWGPTLAFDALEAEVLERVGDLLSDDELVNQGRLVRAKVAQLKQAASLSASAAAQRSAADASYRRRTAADSAARERVEQQADERAAAVEEARVRKQRVADERVRKEAEAARKVEAAQRKQVEKQERAARKTRVEAEQRALSEERAALAAEEKVLDLDAALESTKTARKTRR